MFTYFLQLTFPDFNCGGSGGGGGGGGGIGGGGIGGGDTGGSYLYWQLGWKMFGLVFLWLPLLLWGACLSN